MSPSSGTEQQRTRAAQVGFVMKSYRESFPKEDGGRGIPQNELLRRMAEADPDYARRISHATVSRWESGFTPPTVGRLEVFGRAMGLYETEIDGLILMAGLDPGGQERRTLTCTSCGAETRTVSTERTQNRYNGGSTTVVTRTRRCLGCGSTAESCERWTSDPREAGSQRMQRVLEEIGGASDRIEQALREANTIPGPEHPEDNPEGKGHPGPRE